jgi:RNA polymerase sigma-70 factor (ECF subfamily)
MSLCELWPGAAPSDALEQALDDLLRRARLVDLPVEPATLIPFIAARLGQPDLDVIAHAPAADFLVAHACTSGDPRAIAQFESILAAVRPAIAGLGANREEIDELLQRMRLQLLVGANPGIARFAGRGELRAWVRVIAVREAVRLLTERGRGELVDDERLLEAVAPLTDAEHDLIRHEYRAAFRQAFAEALQSLPAIDRLVLRQHAVDDLSIDAIGKLHGVHRATAARWLERARHDLSAATQRLLRARLNLSLGEVHNLLQLILSRADASVHRLLGA